jgi:Zn-dependent alcohol dehydrogenase
MKTANAPGSSKPSSAAAEMGSTAQGAARRRCALNVAVDIMPEKLELARRTGASFDVIDAAERWMPCGRIDSGGPGGPTTFRCHTGKISTTEQAIIAVAGPRRAKP